MLQLKISALRTMREARKGNRNAPSVKTAIAVVTSPRLQARNGEQDILRTAAM